MILMYHKVYPESPTMWWVEADTFHRQMCELKCRKVVYLDDYDPADREQVVITFDGIYQNVLIFAAPILEHFGYPFELFVTSDYIGKDNSFDRPEPKADFASVEDLRELVRCGGRLQWHSKTHRNLKEMIDRDLITEEMDVPGEIRHLDEKGFKWFAYPHGDFNPVVVDLTKKIFKGGISCIQGNNSDLFTLNRLTVTNKTTFKKGFVSVVIPSYNYGSYIVEAIESVLRQTRPVDEILIADDCSTDNTMEIGTEYQERHPALIKYFRNEQNLGIVSNFNKAVSMASGDYICFLGADNRFRSDYIEKTAEILDSDDRIAIAYTDFALFGPRAKIMYQERFKDDMKGPIKEGYYYIVNFPDFNEEAKQRIKKHNIFHGSSMFRQEAFKDIGGYREEKDMPEDWNLFARMVDKGWLAKRVPHPVLEYRQHSRKQEQLKVISSTELNYYKKKLTEVNRQLTQLAELDSRFAELERQLAERERRLAERSRRLAEKNRQIHALQTSMSWKITAPMRWLADRFLAT